jgi:putative membrane protein
MNERNARKSAALRVDSDCGQGSTMKPASQTADVNTQLAIARTDLAMERSYLAAERTLMGWIRTSLSMISFGFTIGKLGQALSANQWKGLLGARVVSVQDLAYFLVILGTAALLGAALQHWRRLRELHALGLGNRVSLTLAVALLLTAVGGFAFGSLVLAI